MKEKIVDIIVKSLPRDYDWLPYLWRSVEKYVTGFRNVVLILEQSYPLPPLPSRCVVARSCDYPVGSESDHGAVVERMRAWHYSDAERLLYVDSDCVFNGPVDFQTEQAINVERPIVLWRKWEEAGPGAVWRTPARETLGYDPSIETMVRYPFCYPRQVLRDFWNFVGGEERLSGLPSITDWCALGAYAADHHPESVTLVHASVGLATPSCVRQFWSHDRADNPRVQAEMETLGLTR